MQTTEELFNAWEAFTITRETARQDAQKTDSTDPLKQQLAEKTSQLQQVKAEIAMLKAQIMVKGTTGYNKAMFDLEWATRKATLREALEQALMREMDTKSIPQIMNEFAFQNTTMLYRVKKRKEYERQVAEKALDDVQWEWSDFTGTHRYALAHTDNEGWALVKLYGAINTDLEGESCVFDFETGEFISGSLEVFNSDSTANKVKRKNTLADVLAGDYTGPYKESTNPYHEKEAA